MSTSKEEIRRWLEDGKQAGATHVIVAVDQFDQEDYPVYVMPGQDVRAVEKGIRESSMQGVMEVYSMALDIEQQLGERRAFHYEVAPNEKIETPMTIRTPDGRTIGVVQKFDVTPTDEKIEPAASDVVGEIKYFYRNQDGSVTPMAPEEARAAEAGLLSRHSSDPVRMLLRGLLEAWDGREYAPPEHRYTLVGNYIEALRAVIKP